MSAQYESKIALRVLMMPKDTNHEGTIFGGVILSHIDQAAYIEARRHGTHRWVTAAINKVNFIAPVFTGDIVSYRTTTVNEGRTSVTVSVEVEAERREDGTTVPVTSAQLVIVAIDEDRNPTAFKDEGAER
jgi:acyl-CoA thioesterase YciA